MASPSLADRGLAADDAPARTREEQPGADPRKITFGGRGRATTARASWLTGLLSSAAAVATIASLLWIVFRRLAKNPPGFFCDEAEIGYRSWQLLHGTLLAPSSRFPAFYQHIDYTNGALPLYLTAPFIALWGMTETAVRMSAASAMLVGIAALVVLTRYLGLRNGWIGVAAFALSPIVIHMARFNMAHPHGFMVIALGMLLYTVGRDRRLRWLAVGAGLALGASVYANPVWYIAAPATIGCLALGELVVNGLVIARWRSFGAFLGGVLICWIPLFGRMVTDDQFFDRFEAKQGEDTGRMLSWARLQEMLAEVPKYFSIDFLFREVGDPGNLRHAVPGAGLFPWIVLLLVLVGVVAVVHARRSTVKVIGVWSIAMVILLPIADLPTTGPGAAPYTFSMFPMMVGIPVLAGFGVALLSDSIGGRDLGHWRSAVVPVALSAIILIGGWSFYSGPYADYGRVAGGYYGWQFGPSAAIEAFRDDNFQHDAYFLDSDFNGAYVFLDFFLAEDPEQRGVTRLGAPHEGMRPGSAMFAVRPDRWNTLLDPQSSIRQYARLVDVIAYPDGTPALYLISISLQNDPAPIAW